MANEMNRPKKGYVAMKSLFALISVRTGEAIMRGCFCSSNKELRVDKLPATHGAWIEHICVVLMSRLIYSTMILY